MKGTKVEVVIEHLQKLPKSLHLKVTEITLDMAGSMKTDSKKVFSQCYQSHNRFHVQKLAYRFNEVEKAALQPFTTVQNTFEQPSHSDILNYFNNRSTNASAESFNAKVKYFRILYKGVRDRSFFLFRLSKLFA